MTDHKVEDLPDVWMRRAEEFRKAGGDVNEAWAFGIENAARELRSAFTPKPQPAPTPEEVKAVYAKLCEGRS